MQSLVMCWAVCARLVLPTRNVGANVLAVEKMILDTVTMVARAGVPNRIAIETIMGFVRTVTDRGSARHVAEKSMPWRHDLKGRVVRIVPQIIKW